jgi:hypothetical protein
MFPHLSEFGLKHLQGADGRPTGERLTGFRQPRRDLWECLIELGGDAFEHLAGSLSREERIELGPGAFRATRHFLKRDCLGGLRNGGLPDPGRFWQRRLRITETQFVAVRRFR